MRKGSKVIYQNKKYIVWKKENQFVWIYDPGAKMPELTMKTVGIKHLTKI